MYDPCELMLNTWDFPVTVKTFDSGSFFTANYCKQFVHCNLLSLLKLW